MTTKRMDNILKEFSEKFPMLLTTEAAFGQNSSVYIELKFFISKVITQVIKEEREGLKNKIEKVSFADTGAREKVLSILTLPKRLLKLKY